MPEDNNKGKILKVSSENEYILYLSDDDRYYFIKTTDGDSPLICTPSGAILDTGYYALAEKIFEDIQLYGLDYMSPESILPWHYTMCENFATMEHKDIEDMLDSCFLQKNDWTYAASTDADWIAIFGTRSERVMEIEKWLSACTHMQMTAACCIGNAFESINIAFVLSAMMENYKGKELQTQFEQLARTLSEEYCFGPVEETMKVFNNFYLYYGIHLEEEGPIINKPSMGFDSGIQEDYEPLEANISDYAGKHIEIETLVGRNYYHYSMGVLDKKQPYILKMPDVEICEDEEDYEKKQDYSADSLSAYIPSDCWIKRISNSEEEYEANRLIVIALDGNSEIKDVSEIWETVQRVGNGMYMIPGMEMPSKRYYEIQDYLSDETEEEMKRLLSKRYIPDGFTFVGKRLPKEILDEGGNGGDNTNYTYALQSSYRMAYMHMSIDTTEEGIIEDLDYSTYQSTGSGYWDMFSRPQNIGDRHEELVDMLLYIIDKCSEEEYGNCIGK